MEQGYKEKSGKYFHPQYPPQNHLCINKKSYCFNENIGQYIHKKYGQCGTSEMTKRMFEDVGISREITKDILLFTKEFYYLLMTLIIPNKLEKTCMMSAT